MQAIEYRHDEQDEEEGDDEDVAERGNARHSRRARTASDAEVIAVDDGDAASNQARDSNVPKTKYIVEDDAVVIQTNNKLNRRRAARRSRAASNASNLASTAPFEIVHSGAWAGALIEKMRHPLHSLFVFCFFKSNPLFRLLCAKKN